MGRPKLWKYLSKEATDAFYATDHPDEKAAYVPVVSLHRAVPYPPLACCPCATRARNPWGVSAKMGFANDAPDGRVTTVSVLLVNAGNQSRLPLLRDLGPFTTRLVNPVERERIRARRETALPL